MLIYHKYVKGSKLENMDKVLNKNNYSIVNYFLQFIK